MEVLEPPLPFPRHRFEFRVCLFENSLCVFLSRQIHKVLPGNADVFSPGAALPAALKEDFQALPEARSAVTLFKLKFSALDSKLK